LKTYENITGGEEGIFPALLDDVVMAIDFNPEGKSFAFSTASNQIFVYTWNVDCAKIKLLQVLEVSIFVIADGYKF